MSIDTILLIALVVLIIAKVGEKVLFPRLTKKIKDMEAEVARRKKD